MVSQGIKRRFLKGKKSFRDKTKVFEREQFIGLIVYTCGRGASCKGGSNTGRSCGHYRRENAGMSSENYVRIIMAENLRFLEEGSSAQGKPGAKARRKRVVDAHTVENP